MKQDVFAVIRESGRATTMPSDASYHKILHDIGVEFQSAGGNWDHPKMLLRNGVVVVEKGLADRGYEYLKKLRAGEKRAREAAEEAFPPPFTIEQTK